MDTVDQFVVGKGYTRVHRIDWDLIYVIYYLCARVTAAELSQCKFFGI